MNLLLAIEASRSNGTKFRVALGSDLLLLVSLVLNLIGLN